MPLFQVVVVFDKEPVEERVFAEDFFDENQAAVVVEALKNRLDERVAIKRPNELEGQDHNDHGSVLDSHALIQVRANQLVVTFEGVVRQLLTAAFEHLLRIIHADELDVLAYDGVEIQKGITGRTAQIVDVAAGYCEIRRDFGNHALDFLIEWHRTVEHVVEDGSDLFAEGEVAGGLRLFENIIFHGSILGPCGWTLPLPGFRKQSQQDRSLLPLPVICYGPEAFLDVAGQEAASSKAEFNSASNSWASSRVLQIGLRRMSIDRKAITKSRMASQRDLQARGENEWMNGWVLRRAISGQGYSGGYSQTVGLARSWNSCRILSCNLFSQFAFAEPGEDHGGDDEDVDEAAEHAADHRSGEWLHDFGAGARAREKKNF